MKTKRGSLHQTQGDSLGRSVNRKVQGSNPCSGAKSEFEFEELSIGSGFTTSVLHQFYINWGCGSPDAPRPGLWVAWRRKGAREICSAMHRRVEVHAACVGR